jgi:D-cysteine desulfhydrase
VALPLFTRLPRLAHTLAHVDLGVRETPVEAWSVDGVALLAKRDDLSAPALGGNKVRALEFLLGALAPGEPLLTAGPTGSTHALAVAHYGVQLGTRADVVTWPQEMHDVARETAARLSSLSRLTHCASPVVAFARIAARRLRGGLRWIPAGGSSPLGAVGHVNAALELVAQLEREGRAMPDAVVVPLGSGGTAAGLLAGFALAGVTTRVVGVRVVPRVLGNRWHVLRLARRTRALLASRAGEPLPRIDASRLAIVDDAYGGAYGRETATASQASARLRSSGGPRLDGTYSAKTFAAALAHARAAGDGSILFWLTFDARWMTGAP